MERSFTPKQRDSLMRKARERAREESERRWPPNREKEREREEDYLAILYYRQYVGEIFSTQ